MGRAWIIILLFGANFLTGQSYEEISFPHEGLTVFGTLSLPDTEGPYPAIVIHPGTGANDRDGTIPLQGGNAACLYPQLAGNTLQPYLQLGDALTAAGYAVLRYDKVEYTYTTPGELGTITFPKLWLVSDSALDYLRSRPDIDTNQLILLGHSEGSTLIPYIARLRNDVRALVSLAGPRQPLDSLLAYQLPYIAETCGGDVVGANLQAGQILTYFNQVRQGNYNLVPLFGVPAAVWGDYIAVADSVSLNYRAADLPTLIVGMGNDINVPPTETDRLEAEVPDADVYRLPGINHYLTTATDPDLAPAVADTIIAWLAGTLTTGIASPLKWPKSFTVIFDGEFLRLRSGGGPLEQVIISDPSGRMVAKATNVRESVWEVKISDWPAGWYAVSAYRGAYQQGEWVFVKRKE